MDNISNITSLTPDELRQLDPEGNLYSILRAVESLERLFTAGQLSQEKYVKERTELISQYQTVTGALNKSADDVKRFIKKYNIECPMAEFRLFEPLAPADIEKNDKSEKASNARESKLLYRLSSEFTTLFDSIHLEPATIEQISPELRDVIHTASEIPKLKELEKWKRLQLWKEKFHKMSVFDVLSEEDKRQLLFDCEAANNEIQHRLEEEERF